MTHCVALEEQAEYLATQWMSVGQLEKAGIPCRRGPFVEQEIDKINHAIGEYQKEHNLDDGELENLIYSSDRTSGFWSRVARAVPQRGVKSIFYYVRRARNNLGKAGKWSAAEDEQLLRAVETHGSDWFAVADVVHRSTSDCSDRYRQHVRYKDTKRRGAWSSEEEGRLLLAIEELARNGKTDMSTRGFWGSVSKALGVTRTPKQCQSKWSDTLRGKVENQDKTRRWKEEDSYILVCKIASLDVGKETDVDWKSLGDPSWNMWSGHILQQKWRRLKALCEADSAMCHRDIVHLILTRTRPTISGTPALSPTST